MRVDIHQVDCVVDCLVVALKAVGDVRQIIDSSHTFLQLTKYERYKNSPTFQFDHFKIQNSGHYTTKFVLIDEI